MTVANIRAIGRVIDAERSAHDAQLHEPVSFETHVKPLFRERDRKSMEFAFDLWSRDDVSQHADAILAASGRTMPCDGASPQAQVTSSTLGRDWQTALTRRGGDWESSAAGRPPIDPGRGHRLAIALRVVLHVRTWR